MITQKEFLEKIALLTEAKNDSDLARKLEVGAPLICRLKQGALPIGDSLILRVHEITGLPIREIKSLLGKPCFPIYRAPLEEVPNEN